MRLRYLKSDSAVLMDKIHKVGVIGSRTIIDKSAVWGPLNDLRNHATGQGDKIVVLSGGAKGVDTLAAQWAEAFDVPFILFKPYFLIDSRAPYDPRHYFTRNKQIIDNSDMVIAFWDGYTKGASWGINYARKNKKTLIIVDVPTDLDSGVADK